MSSLAYHLEPVREADWGDVGVSGQVHDASQLDNGDVIVQIA